MTMKGTPVPPEGLDHVKDLERWLLEHPNDGMVRSKLSDLQRDPRFAEPDEPDDIMPEIPALTDFPVPARTEKIRRRGEDGRRSQHPHISRVHRRYIQPTRRRGHRRPEQGQRSASIRLVLCRRLRERLEEKRGVPRNHAGPRRGRRTGGSPPP